MKSKQPKQSHFDQHARDLVLPRLEAATGRGASYLLKQQVSEDAGHMGYWMGAWLVFNGSAWVPLLHRTAMKQYEWCRANHQPEVLRALLDMEPILADRTYYEPCMTDLCVVFHRLTSRAQLRLVSGEP
jgi:hypothetical protein